MRCNNSVWTWIVRSRWRRTYCSRPNGVPKILMPCSARAVPEPRKTVVTLGVHGPCGSVQRGATIRPGARTVPHPGFPVMDSDASVSPQFLLQNAVHLGHSFWRCLDVDIVQEREHHFIPPELALDCTQGAVLPQRKEEWHHRIPLFSSFSLVNVMYQPFCIPSPPTNTLKFP